MSIPGGTSRSTRRSRGRCAVRSRSCRRSRSRRRRSHIARSRSGWERRPRRSRPPWTRSPHPNASRPERSFPMPRTAAARSSVTVRITKRVATKPTLVPVPRTYTKDELLTRFAPLVRHVVERVAATLPKNVDHEDLYSAGVLGLLDAHAKFDPRKGVKFETYAVWRIKGAVLDQLRALDWVSRPRRRKARNLDGVTRKLDQKLGRAATEDEVAREMKLSRGDYSRLLDHVRGAVLVSLDESRAGEDQEPSTLADHLPDTSL